MSNFWNGFITGVVIATICLGLLVKWNNKIDIENTLEENGIKNISFISSAHKDACDMHGSYEIIYTEDDVRKTAIACKQVVLK